MFSELPKLFERNFAIGFFLPTAVFVAINLFALLPESVLFSKLLIFLKKDILIGTTITGLTVWLCAVFLLVLNRDIYRILEGYGILNPARFFGYFERKHYQKINQDLSDLNKKWKQLHEKLGEVNESIESPKKISCADATKNKQKIKKAIVMNESQRAKLMREKAERFPDDEKWLLPTAFGNTIRAFEVYPRVMYGLDAIPGWERLLAVIPKDYRTFIDDAKAQTDFWVNLWFFNLILLFEYAIVYAFIRSYNPFCFLPIAVFVLFAFFTSYRARLAAAEWGQTIKASFDVFLPDLYEKLCFQYPLSRGEERQNLKSFSQAILYRSESSMHDRALSKRKKNNEDYSNPK